MKRFYLAISAAILCATACVSVASAATSDTLTLTTYNIHSAIPVGFNQRNHAPGMADIRNIADVLTTTSADIIALQEVRNLWDFPAKNKPSAMPLDVPLILADLLQMNYCFGSTINSSAGYTENRGYIEWGDSNKWTNNGNVHGEFGNAILTRAPMAGEPQIVKLPRGDAAGMKKGDEPRNAVRAALADPLPGLGHVIIYGTHFQHNNGKTREAQMRKLLTVAGQDAKKPDTTVFLMGDFNHSPHPGEPNLLGMVKDAGFHDLAAEFAAKSGQSPQTSMHGKQHTGTRIDYVFCSRAVDVKDVTVLDSKASDHLPVTVKIALK